MNSAMVVFGRRQPWCSEPPLHRMLEKHGFLGFFSNYFCKALNVSVPCMFSSLLAALLCLGRTPNRIFKHALIFEIWNYEKGEAD